MNPQLWWYVARATGLVAWALSVASILWGLALSTRALGKQPRAPWLLDLHRFLGAATIAFVLAHVGALVADSYVTFDPFDVFVPFASEWRPGAVAWGVVALWLLVAIQVSSLFMRRLPKRVWRAIHLSSYIVAVAATAHGLAAGADADHPVVRLAWPVAGAAIVFFTAYRVVGPGRAGDRPSASGAAAPEAPGVPDRRAAIEEAKRRAGERRVDGEPMNGDRNNGSSHVDPEAPAVNPAAFDRRAAIEEAKRRAAERRAPTDTGGGGPEASGSPDSRRPDQPVVDPSVGSDPRSGDAVVPG